MSIENDITEKVLRGYLEHGKLVKNIRKALHGAENQFRDLRHQRESAKERGEDDIVQHCKEAMLVCEGRVRAYEFLLHSMAEEEGENK